MDIIFASLNKNKIKEIQAILKDYDIISLIDLNETHEVIENGKSFKENAFLKANYFYQKYKIPTFADDSGLVVKALNGEPGIYSARYAHKNATPNENNLLLLQKLEGVSNRQAYFISMICYIDNDGRDHYFGGLINGEISYELKGDNGFGYDPLFIVPSISKTLGELDKNIKNNISHRFLALSKLNNYLKKEVK